MPFLRVDVDLRQVTSSQLRRAFVRYDPPSPANCTGGSRLNRRRLVLDHGDVLRGGVHPLLRAPRMASTWSLVSRAWPCEVPERCTCRRPAGIDDRQYPGMISRPPADVKLWLSSRAQLDRVVS